MRQERLKGKAGIMETVKNAVSIFSVEPVKEETNLHFRI